MKFTLLVSTLATAVVATAIPSFAQMPAPTMLNVVHYQVKADHLQEFLEVEKQIAGSYKKAASTDQFRIIYRGSVANTFEFDVFTPLSKFADRDGENPYTKMATEEERLTRTARLAQYMESVQTSIDRQMCIRDRHHHDTRLFGQRRDQLPQPAVEQRVAVLRWDGRLRDVFQRNSGLRSPLSYIVDTTMAGDLSQPEGHVFRALQFIHLAIEPQKHVLRDLFGSGSVPQKVIRQAENHRLIRAQHFCESHLQRGLRVRFRH